MLKGKGIILISVSLIALAALYSIIRLALMEAVLWMTALFTVTNGFRAKSFKEQGLVRESKWMLGMSLFFGIAFIFTGIYLLMN